MKTGIVLATTAASLVVLGGIAIAATPGTSNGVTAKLVGQGAASYTDAVFGDVTCNETQHPKFDTVSCRIANPNPSLAGTSGTVGWLSDFNGTFGTLTYSVSADGMHYTGKATY
jgi:hypothetical protein